MVMWRQNCMRIHVLSAEARTTSKSESSNINLTLKLIFDFFSDSFYLDIAVIVNEDNASGPCKSVISEIHASQDLSNEITISSFISTYEGAIYSSVHD
mmetsp:Transcript_13641/g.19883  ORF Transcript_13641/g.19883 Transcript_13641/m.19883 type:complete len:98 (+) Transcript_13641:605-898(+)